MSKTKTIGLLPAWLELGKVVAILVPLLYTAGWSYAYHYFNNFHLGLLGLNIPKEYFFVYSFWAFKSQWVFFVLSMVGLTTAYAVVKLVAKMKKRKSSPPSHTSHIDEETTQTSMPFLLTVAALGLFCWSYWLGAQAAQNDYDDQKSIDFPSYPRVKLCIKSENNRPKDDKMLEWEKGCYRLLLRNDDHIYLFYPGKGKGDKIPTDIVPAEIVESLRVLPLYTSCNE